MSDLPFVTLSDCHVQFYHPLGRWQGMPPIEGIITIATTGRGFSTVPGGASFMMQIDPCNLNAVHQDVLGCSCLGDVISLKGKWHNPDYKEIVQKANDDF